MRTIIAGSRQITDYEVVKKAIELSGVDISLIVSGSAEGVDKLGEQYAEKNKIPVVRYPAEWDKYGKSAGPRRNKVMARNADVLIAIWDGDSRGTKNMIDTAIAQGLIVIVWLYKNGNIVSNLRLGEQNEV